VGERRFLCGEWGSDETGGAGLEPEARVGSGDIARSCYRGMRRAKELTADRLSETERREIEDAGWEL
jgi:hypothetical protein